MASLDEQITQTVDPVLFTRLCNAVLTAEHGHGYQVVDGTRGDGGNDGWLDPERRMFAFYCPMKPEQRTDANFRAKAFEDLEKAVGQRDRGNFPVERWTFVTPRPLAVAAALGRELPYDPVKDFIPVTFIGRTPHVLAVYAQSPVNSLVDLIELAKKRPGSVTYGTLGEGTYSHLVGKLFEKVARVQLLQVPFRGSAPSIAALVSDQITMVFGNLPEIMPHVREGRLKAIAIASARRSPLATELPTIVELGYPGFTSESWYGLLAPAGVPGEIVLRLQREVARSLRHPAVVERLKALGVEPGGEPPADFERFLHEQIEAYAAIVKEAHIWLNDN